MAKKGNRLRGLWSGISRNISTIVAVSSLVVAIITLIVAIVALKIADSSLSSANQSLAIAEQSLVLSSKDFAPVFEFDVDDDLGIVNLKNQTPTLYKVEGLNVYEIVERGLELKNNDSLVLFSLLSRAAHCEDYHFGTIGDNGEDSSEITMNFNIATHLSSMQICYHEGLIHLIDNYLSAYYNIDSPLGYALPSLRSVSYLLEVFYSDRLGQMRTAYLLQEHIHGRGWRKQTIQEEQFRSLLQQAEHKQVESMADIDSIMDYFITNCKVALK